MIKHYIITANKHLVNDYFKKICNDFNQKYLYINKNLLKAKVIVDKEEILSIETILLYNISQLYGYRFGIGNIYIDNTIINNQDIYNDILLRCDKHTNIVRLDNDDTSWI